MHKNRLQVTSSTFDAKSGFEWLWSIDEIQGLKIGGIHSETQVEEVGMLQKEQEAED